MSWSDFSVHLNWYCQQLEVYYKCSKINSDDTIDMTARPVPCCPKQHQSLDTFASTHIYWYTIEMDNEIRIIIVKILTSISKLLIFYNKVWQLKKYKRLFYKLKKNTQFGPSLKVYWSNKTIKKCVYLFGTWLFFSFSYHLPNSIVL